MKSKIFALILLTVIIASLAVVSAELTSVVKGLDFSKSNNFSYFELTNTYGDLTNVTISAPSLQINDGSNHYMTISLNPVGLNYNNVAINGKIRINATLVIDSNFALNLGNYDFPIINITAINSTNASITELDQLTFSFINSFCTSGDVPTNGTLLEITQLVDENLDNADDWDWSPLDNIEVSVRVANKYGKDINVILEYGLYDPTTKSLINLDEETIDLSIDKGESVKETIAFRIPADITEGSDYRFYVKAYKDSDQNTVCADKRDSDYFKLIQIQKEPRAVVVDDITLSFDSAFCGDEVELRAKVYNVGNGDETKALIKLYNKELGINMNKVVERLNSGDSESIVFDFKIPANATEKTYTLDLQTMFKYNEDNGGCSTVENANCYDKTSADDLDKTFSAILKVEGNCIKPETVVVVTDKVDITAGLQSDKAEAGKEIVIKSTVKNSGTSSQTYAMLVSGTDDFAIVQKIEPQSFTLEAGKSQDVLITLKANDDAKGDYTFNIKTIYGSKTKEQPVTLSIEAKTGIFSKISDPFSNFKGNWFIWLVVAINIILILVIVLMIIKIAKK